MGNKARTSSRSSSRSSSRPAARPRSPRLGAGPLLVFVGPSLPSAEARALAPRAELRPPIAVGELLALAHQRRPPGCVAILDGYFERMAAVWHKEILVALGRGIAVYGAASMGALRAAELGPWGMIGVGEETGTLDSQFARLSAEYSLRLQRLITNLSEVIKPVVVLLAGGMFVFLIVALLLPVYDLVKQAIASPQF